MDARVRALAPPAVDRPGAEVDIANAQLDEFRCSKPVAVGEEDHRVVPHPVPLAALRRAQERPHLILREVVAQAPVRCHTRNVPDELRSSTPAAGSEG